MNPLRLVLILFLTIALDLSVPLPSHSVEASAECEEVLHARQERRAFRLLREAVAPAIAQEIRRVEVERSPRIARATFEPATSVTLARKLPPALAEPSSAPEDH